MTFADYLDSLQCPEKEQELRALVEQSGEAFGTDDEFAQAAKIPYVGKLLLALEAFCETHDTDEFRQTAHYELLKNWDVDVRSIEKGSFVIYPGAAHRKKAGIAFAAVSAVVAGFWLWRRRCKKRK